jgi:gliding motility-associated-like protein
MQPVIIPSWYTGCSYSWTPVLAVDFPDNPFAVFKGSDTTSLVLTVTTPAGCTGADSTMILVHPGNFASVSNDLALCPHDSAQLLATGGITYHWSPETYLSSNSDPAPWVRPITSTSYTVIVADRFDCLDTLSVFVTVHPGAVFYLTDAVTIYPGESYQISPQTNCSYFNWTPTGGLSAKYLSNPVANPVVSTRYRVKASTEFGCLIEDEIDINVDPSTSVTIPNAFSPANGNLLRIISRGPVKLNYFRIFNRWGNLVFETQHIEDGWDGTFHGIPQPVGVFVFQIDAVTGNGDAIRKQGNVTLLR